MEQLAELSSLATALEDLLRRITTMAERVTGADRDVVVSELFEVERTLGAAHRRLTRILDRSQGPRSH